MTHFTLNKIGFWPRDYDEHAGPEFLCDESQDLEMKNKIVGYLKSGEELFGWLGFSYCRFRCDTPDTKMGCRDLTDGEWVWPEGFSHYISDHNISLPNEFIEHIKQRGFDPSIPVSIKPTLNSIKEEYPSSSKLLTFDETIWRAWLKAKGERDFLKSNKIGKRTPPPPEKNGIDLWDLL